MEFIDDSSFYGNVVSDECIKNLTVIDPVIIDEQLVTDYINIAGYTTVEAYEAAELVAKFDTTPELF